MFLAEQVHTCIYCLRLLPADQFNRDHVLPQHLGRFQGSFVLHETVCRVCNQILGEQLESWLGRESFVALQRLLFGQKPISEMADFRGSGVKLHLPPGSPWAGAMLTLRADVKTGEPVVDLVPQIGVKRPGDAEFRYFMEEEFESARDQEVGAEKGSNLKVVGLGQVESDRLMKVVQRRVPSFRVEGSMPTPPSADGGVKVAVTATINSLLARSIAKIAFNYAAYFGGTDLARDEAISEIRRFIRYGEGSWRRFVSLRNKPILANDAVLYGAFRGHVVTLDWPAMRESIYSDISLFNEIAYNVTLAESCRAIWRPLRFGHYFDWENGQIKELASTGLILPWQMVKP